MTQRGIGRLVGIFAMAIVSVGGGDVLAQLDAPTAFSDFAGCSHHTCIWVPWSTNKTFQNGDLTYTVDTKSKDGDFVLRKAGKELLRTPLTDLSASTSVVWSEDRTHFAVTWSDGGEIGGFHVRVFHVEGNSVTELPSAQRAFDAFKVRHWCEARGDNIQAYAWLPNSTELILVLSVYPTSDCGKDLGHTEAYVVEAATGVIRQHWDVEHLNAYIHSHPE